MKKALSLFVLAGFLISIPSVSIAEEGHHHDHVEKADHPDHGAEHKGGPKGGRLLENTDPHAEFFVEKDRTALITLYDDAMKPVPASGQSATLIVDTNGSKTNLKFEQKGDILVTNAPLPEGDSHNVVLQFKASADAKPKNFRMTLDGKSCPDCNRAEYACACAH